MRSAMISPPFQDVILPENRNNEGRAGIRLGPPVGSGVYGTVITICRNSLIPSVKDMVFALFPTVIVRS